MLPQPAKDAGHIFRCGFPDGSQVAAGNVRLAVAKDALNGGVVQHFAELPQHALPDSQHTLVCPELLHIALVGNRTALVDIHDIHGAVADVAEHIRSCKVPKICCNGGKALREDVRACKLHMVVHASESEVRRFLLQKIRPESVLLFADPCEGQTCGKMDAGRGKMANVQLPSDGGKGEDIVVAVRHFISGKLLVSLADGVVPALIDQQIILEGRLPVVNSHAGAKAGVGGLDVAVPVFNADDNGIVVQIIHTRSFLPLCGCQNGWFSYFLFCQTIS